MPQSQSERSESPIHVLLSCFDISGDHHAANLIEYTNKYHPNRFIFSVLSGQEIKKIAQKKETKNIIFLEETVLESSIGLLEGAKFIVPTLKLFSRIKTYISNSKSTKKTFIYKAPNQKEKYVPNGGPIDFLLCVDGQGKNLPLAKRIQKEGISIIYFFPPPVFIWGKWCIKELLRFDLVLCPFAENHEILSKAGCHSIYTGHPLAFKKNIRQPNQKIYQDLKISQKNPLLSIFPGSRMQEIEQLAMPFLTATLILMEKHPNLQCLISLSHRTFLPFLKGQIKKLAEKNPKKKDLIKKIRIVYGKWDEIIACSSFAFLCSGTVTLPAALHGTPHLIAYHISPLSFLLGKILLYVKYIGIANIIAKHEIAPEFINRHANVKKFVETADIYLSDKQKAKEKRKELRQHTRKLLRHESPFSVIIEAITHLAKKKRDTEGRT